MTFDGKLMADRALVRTGLTDGRSLDSFTSTVVWAILLMEVANQMEID